MIVLRCIKKCISGLTAKQLDAITDSLHKTLAHPQGRKLFEKYLSREKFTGYHACLKFYDKCCLVIEKIENFCLSASNPDLTISSEYMNEAFDIAANLNGVPEIDLEILERFDKCLTNPTCDSMFGIMHDLKIRRTRNLQNIFKHFRTYALKPYLEIK